MIQLESRQAQGFVMIRRRALVPLQTTDPFLLDNAWKERPLDAPLVRPKPSFCRDRLRMFLSPSTMTFSLTRIVLLRALALVYFVAFTVALRQNKALIGDDGITPARYELLEARQRAVERKKQRDQWLDGLLGDTRKKRSPLTTFKLRIQKHAIYQRLREVLWDRADRMGRPLMSVFWLAGKNNYERLNPWLDAVAVMGMTLSGLVGTLGAANVPILLTLWICQRSLMSVGGCWYGFGWEPQLAEMGFHALFLVPLLSLQPIPLSNPTPHSIVIWSFRWFLFRIMMGAGLIKFKSNDRKWKDLTAMNYFYETQPVPSVLTRTMHFMPTAFHKFEVLINHFVEVVAPWFLILPFVPCQIRRAAGLIQIIFQLVLISTGNLSFLNWLTMIPAIACLDDACLRRLFAPSRVVEASIMAAVAKAPTIPVVPVLFGALVTWLSVPVVQNLLAKRQQMNASFDPLRLINTYGAFGVVDEVREEWIISSAASRDMEEEWKEYEFKVKPGNVHRKPRWITPYHYRLDWQMWIASSCRTLDRSPWLYRFLIKLLQRNQGVQDLLAEDPWKDSTQAPKYIRVDAYKYKFHRPGEAKDGGYWEREFVRRVYPPQGAATLESLQEEIQASQPGRPI
ncbi:Lipase maturation factor 1 [Seminavis robusta]|uniref:Lipase maturation factor 1 n=1 Tax=Seminavis robusta TaxID=568900 RepID=A0A9N8HSA2_9STRA|nr:Lipase maturation factor 1 [Seminavis robusta]|eukprot:Sro1416_g270820.1 Lipase maturation factor 1 (624) ;mRNA; f:10437-12308